MSSNRAALRSVPLAMLCAGVVTAQYIVGKATRDALFLAQFDFTALPTIFIITSFVSIALVAVNSKVSGKLVPRVIVPVSFAVSGALFVVEWLLIDRAPRGIARGAARRLDRPWRAVSRRRRGLRLSDRGRRPRRDPRAGRGRPRPGQRRLRAGQSVTGRARCPRSRSRELRAGAAACPPACAP